jgi:hypothetical protein
VKWVIVLAWIMRVLLGPVDAGAAPNTEVDESKPELVKRYMFMNCELLEASYEFQYIELEHLYEHLTDCHEVAELHPEYAYGEVMCLYVQMQWEYVYDHIKSVEKAWRLMCDEDGTRKNPVYEIEF